jgi:uncharacterized protein YfaT (DUF1175 family)
MTLAFDGDTYEPERDADRLGAQMRRVAEVMRNGKWMTLAGIAEATNDPEASVSARLRDLRKKRNGAHVIEREYVMRGLFRYRMVV